MGATTSGTDKPAPAKTRPSFSALMALGLEGGTLLLGETGAEASSIKAFGLLREDPLPRLDIHPDAAAMFAVATGEIKGRARRFYLAYLPGGATAHDAMLRYGVLLASGEKASLSAKVASVARVDKRLLASVMMRFETLFTSLASRLPPVATALRPPLPAARPAAKAPPVAAALGSFDTIIDGVAHGWAFDPSARDQRLTIEIVEGDRIVARGLADRFRDDLVTAGIGDGRHHFRLRLSYEISDDLPHQLHARIAGTGQVLPNGPIAFQQRPLTLGDFAALTRAETLDAARLSAVGRRTAFVTDIANANLCLEMRDIDGARAAFEKLIAHYGEHPLARCKLAETYLMTGAYQDALSLYEAAVAQPAAFWGAWFGAGEAYRLTKNWPLAEQAYRKAAELAPGHQLAVSRLRAAEGQALDGKIESLLSAGKLPEAETLLRAAVIAAPDDPALCRRFVDVASRRRGRTPVTDGGALGELQAAEAALAYLLDWVEAERRAA